MRFERHRSDEIVIRGDEPEREPGPLCAAAGKIMHENEAAAMRAASYQMSKGSPPLRTYFCLYCQKWHLAKEQ